MAIPKTDWCQEETPLPGARLIAAYGTIGFHQYPSLEFTGAFYVRITLDGKPIIERLNDGIE